MNCSECALLLLDYHYDTLEASRRAEVEAHLRECATCAATLHTLEHSVPDQLGWPDEDPPAGLAQRANAKIDAERPAASVVPLAKKPGASPVRSLLKIAAMIALVALGGWGWSVHQRRVSVAMNLDGQDQLSPGALSTLRMSIVDVDTEQPIAGANLKVLLRGPDGKETVLYQGPSDRFGTVDAGTRLPDLPEGGYTLVATATKDGDSTSLTRPITLARRTRVLLSSDKPTYQPGQTIHVRALARDSATGKPPEGSELTFLVLDAKGNKVGRKIVKVDRFGSASLDFALADEILLGSWKVRAEMGGATSDLDLSVARYTLPKFEVKLTPDKPWYKPGEVVSGRIESRYFFGKPVAGAKIKLDAGVFVDSFRTVAQAQGVADAQGVWGFEIALPPALPGLSLTQGSAAVDLKLEVLDAAGERVEKHHGLVVAEDDLAVTAVPEGGVLVPGVENRLLVLVARPNGEPVPGAKVALPMIEGIPAGVTAEDGIATLTFVPKSERRDLTVRVQATDGSVVNASTTVSSERLPGVVRTERTIYTAGETVKGEILATSPAGVCFLDVVRDGTTIATHTVPLAGGKGAFAVDLPAEAAGTVTLYAYTPGRDTGRSRKTLFVGEPRSLKVSIQADAETYRPGKEARLTLKAEGEDGKPVVAGVAVAVVDESVFALVAKEPALLKAYFLLAEELSKPRYELDPASVVSDPRRDRAAALLFSHPRDPEIHRVGATDHAEIQTRRASLMATQSSANRTTFGFGLLLLGVVFEGLLRFFFERLFKGFLKDKWWRSGALIFGAVLGLYAKFDGGDALAMVVVGLVPLLLVLFVEMLVWLVRKASAGWILLGGLGAVVLIMAFISVTFSRNMRAAMSASASALGGNEEDAEVWHPATHRKAIDDFDAHKFDKFDTLAWRPEGAAFFSYQVKPATAAEKAQVRVRSWFPETMFWSPSVITGPDGLASFSVPVADSITRWRVSATASAADGRIGVGSGALKVYQDFFVDIDLPVALTVGDEVEVPIAVHNYLATSQTVKLEVEQGDWFQTLGPNVQELALGADEVKGVPLKLRATAFGKKTLTVYAFGSALKDAVRKEIEVRPDGVQAESSVGGTLGERPQTATATLPAGTIAGSEKVLLRVYPGVFSAALEGLEGVLRMPGGCFEQTSSSTFPNVLVLDYLRRSKAAKPDLEARAIEYIQQGYQRLLSFEVKGGGFEWFGRAPANLVLTSYGLLEFADMSRVYEVDPAVIRRTQEWLVAQQESDGSWRPDPQSLRDGLYRDDFAGRTGTTAYVAWALAESGYRGPSLDRALAFLASRAGEARGSYLKALSANALLLGDHQSAAQDLLDELERGALADGDKVRFPAGARTAMYGGGETADAESTALSALALSRAGRMEKVKPALDWLLSTRDAHGAWGSTQSTVLVLRTLLSSQAGGADPRAEGEVLISWSGEAIEKLLIKPETSDLVQTVDLSRYARPGKPLSVQVALKGSARAQYQLVTRAWVPKPEKEEALTLSVNYDKLSLAPDDTLTARASATWNRAGASGMVMLALGVPPGFEVDAESVGRLVAEGKVGKFTLTGKELLLYVDALRTHEKVDYAYQLRARFPVRAKAPASLAYLYYQPEVKAESAPIALVVKRQ